MHAGSARVEITPPKGLPMGGYPERTDPAEDVHDPLFARALVLDDGAQRVAIIATDLPDIASTFAADIRSRVERELGIPADHVLVTASRTHAGPIVAGRRLSVPDPFYLDTLRDRLVGAVRAATRAPRPVLIGAGRAKVYLGVNRRSPVPGGPATGGRSTARYASPYVHMLVVAEERGGPIAILFSYAAHPVVLGPENRLVSGDYAGCAERVIEGNFGDKATALFTLGFSGDVDVNCARRDFDEVETVGTALGRAVIEEMKSVQLLGGLPLRVRSLHVPLPLEPPPTPAEAERRLAAEREHLGNLYGRGENKAEVVRQRMRVDWASELVQVAHRAQGEQSADLEVNGIAIGRTVLIGLSAEPFAEYEKALCELSPFEHALPISCMNGNLGCVPTAEALAEGGYEVETAPYLYGALRLRPEADPALRQALARVIVDLAG